MPKNLTFSQRYGYEPLPEPMRLEQLSQKLRVAIWDALLEILDEHISYLNALPYYWSDDCGQEFAYRICGKLCAEVPKSERPAQAAGVLDMLKPIILGESFNKVLDLIELIAGDADEARFAKPFADAVKKLLDEHEAAYRLDTSERPYQIVPRASKEAGEAAQRAVEAVQCGGMVGASRHLRDAVTHINARQYGHSIVDSIHAVESVARKIDTEASKTLAPALKSLEKSGLLKHDALKEAFDKLYGYANDEQGLRHALIDRDAPDVGLDEALFMYGACASFAAYLTDKHRQRQEGEN